MRRQKNDRGATLIEASLVMPIMLLVMIGTLELGLAFKDYLTVSFTTREATRVGALAGNDPNADCYIVQAAIDSLGPSDLSDFKGLQIFAADPKTGNQIASKTNTWKYTGSDPYDCVNDWTVDEKWPSTTRNVLFGKSSTLDIIGVRVVKNHDWITGLPPFSGSFSVDEVTISRMEPEGFE